MPSYKLTYFPIRGRGEAIRLLFAAAGVKYEDCRVSSEEFKKLKASGKLPYGQLPVLEVDGKMLAQSITIFRYVAKEIGFSPTDNFELAKAEMIVDGIIEVITKAMKFAYESDEEKKKALKPFFEKDLPDSLVILEKFVKSNQDGKHLVGNKNLQADENKMKQVVADETSCSRPVLSLDGLFHQRKEDIPEALNDFPLLKDLYSLVLANPGIKEWLSKRPVTSM